MPYFANPNYWTQRFGGVDGLPRSNAPLQITEAQWRAGVSFYFGDSDGLINQLVGFASIGWIRTNFDYWWIKPVGDAFVPPTQPNSIPYPTEIVLGYQGVTAPTGGAFLLDFSQAVDSQYLWI